MIIKTTYFWIGVVLLLAGGALLAFGDGGAVTSVGTTMGIVGVALIVWAWFGTRNGGEPAG